MRALIRGLLLRGLYAPRSIRIPNKPVRATEMTNDHGPRQMKHDYAEKRYVRRYHQQIAVSEINQPDDPIDHGVADRYQAIQTAQGQSEDNLLKYEGAIHC